MFKRFLLFASGLLVVLSGPPSRALAEGDHSHGANARAAVVAAERSFESRTVARDALGGNQEQ